VTNELTHLDLFSGIGGFSLAFEAEGFKTIGFSEIDPFAAAVLRKHWPDVPNYGDIRNVPRGRCHVITGGFPCQPFSQVRQTRGAKGKADDRYLWPAMLHVIKEWRPPWVVGENVVGIINMALDTCISDLENLGYAVQPIVIPACALGAVHIRKRVWILAHSASLGCPTLEEIYHPPTSQSGGPKSAKRNRGRRCLPELAASNQRAVSLLCEQSVPAESVPAESVPADSGSNDGFSAELDAIRCYGNALVPQVAQIFARAIKQPLTPLNDA